VNALAPKENAPSPVSIFAGERNRIREDLP
jgi:hypothetical protein